MFLPHNAPSIFSADMLRSGSTHIQYSLCSLLGWRPVAASGLHGEGSGEQNINPVTTAILTPYGHQVFGGHHVAYPDLLDYLGAFKLRPMITVRNLYDTIISIKDRIDQTWPSKVMPGLFVPDEWLRWNDEEQYTWLAYNAGAWQLKFFASWKVADIDKLWVRYEEFYADQHAGFKRILDYYELPHPSADALDLVVACRNNNFNRGVSGRGDSLPRKAKHILDGQMNSWGSEISAKARGMLY
jgi:hypothetical protein